MTDPTPPPAPALADHPKIVQFRHQVFTAIDRLREELQAITTDAEESRYIQLLMGNSDRCFAHRCLADDFARHINDLAGSAFAPMTTMALYGTVDERMAIIGRLSAMYRDGANKLEAYVKDWRAHVSSTVRRPDQEPAEPAAPDGDQP